MKISVLVSKYKSLIRSNIFKVFYSTSFTTGLKILATVALSKIVAVRLGPAGLALLGQLTNFVTIVLLLASGGFGNGIIKYVSSLKFQNDFQTFSRQSLKITLIFSLGTALIIISARNQFSLLNFNSPSYSYVFIALGLSTLFYSVGNYFLSFINGMTDYKTLNWSNSINSIVSLVFSILLIYLYGLSGAFIAVAINQSILGIVTLSFSKKYFQYFTFFWKEKIESVWFKKLFSFSIMAIVTAILTPVAQIVIRKHLILTYSIAAAGEWEAINRISSLYLTVLVNVMLVYYLPRLSSINSKQELSIEIIKGFKFFTPIVILLAIGIFLFRGIIINIFLSNKFNAIRPFFLPQLIGDVFKILSFIYAYLVIAKAKVYFYIISEVLFIGIYLVLSLALINKWGNIGAVYAYSATYLFYFLFQLIITRKYIFNEHSYPDNGFS